MRLTPRRFAVFCAIGLFSLVLLVLISVEVGGRRMADGSATINVNVGQNRQLQGQAFHYCVYWRLDSAEALIRKRPKTFDDMWKTPASPNQFTIDVRFSESTSTLLGRQISWGQEKALIVRFTEDGETRYRVHEIPHVRKTNQMTILLPASATSTQPIG